MRIGYLLEQEEEIRQPPFNGPANHVRQVFFHLQKAGHQMALLLRARGRIWVSRDLEELSLVKVERTDVGLQRIAESLCRRTQATFRLPYVGYFESRRFAHASIQALPDCNLFYERFSWMHYGGYLASRWTGIPWIVEFNGDPLADLEAKGMAPTGLQRRLSRAIMRRTLARADHVVASGTGWLKNGIDRWGLNPARSSIVENGTDLLSLLARSDLRSFGQDGTSEGRIAIVYLGGFYPWHGIDQLLRAVARLVNEVPLHLTMIGAGDGEQDARRLAEQLGLSGCVAFRGRLTADEYAPILAAADLGVAPYCGWAEYSGLKIFDYKAAGLACVASGENGRHPTLRHGETGWIVPPCDEAALAEALGLLARDPGLRRLLGRAARLDAEGRHSWDHTVKQLEAVFSRVSGPRRADSQRTGQNEASRLLSRRRITRTETVGRN